MADFRGHAKAHQDRLFSQLDLFQIGDVEQPHFKMKVGRICT